MLYFWARLFKGRINFNFPVDKAPGPKYASGFIFHGFCTLPNFPMVRVFKVALTRGSMDIYCADWNLWWWLINWINVFGLWTTWWRSRRNFKLNTLESKGVNIRRFDLAPTGTFPLFSLFLGSSTPLPWNKNYATLVFGTSGQALQRAARLWRPQVLLGLRRRRVNDINLHCQPTGNGSITKSLVISTWWRDERK